MPARNERLLEHDYDGIREFDNPTPGWWHLIFIASVVFSIFYAAFWHGSPIAWSEQEKLSSDQKAYYGMLFRDLGELEPEDATFSMLMQDAKWMAFGGTIFAANCAQCHGSDGTGINGANLTDSNWINVKKITDLYSVVTDGVVTKGMPEWKNRLSQNERILVAAYVAKLRDDPKPGRAPEGDIIPAWQITAFEASASTKK